MSVTNRSARDLALLTLLATNCDSAPALLARHPSPPEHVEVLPGLRDLLWNALRQEEDLLDRVTGHPVRPRRSGPVHHFLRRRALVGTRETRDLARKLPTGLCRLLLSDGRQRRQALTDVGISAHAIRLLQVRSEQRVEFLAPLGTDLARAVVDRITREVALLLSHRTPSWFTEELARVIDSAARDASRDELLEVVGTTVARGAWLAFERDASPRLSPREAEVASLLTEDDEAVAVPPGEDGALLMAMIDEAFGGTQR